MVSRIVYSPGVNHEHVAVAQGKIVVVGMATKVVNCILPPLRFYGGMASVIYTDYGSQSGYHVLQPFTGTFVGIGRNPSAVGLLGSVGCLGKKELGQAQGARKVMVSP